MVDGARGLEHDHSPEAIRKRLESGPSQSYLRDWVYGGIDGAVTTFAIISGVVGADLSPRTILILGVANLLGDGFSMAASNFLGTRTELDERRRVEQYEREQIRKHPRGEVEEVRQILIAKGFTGELLEKAVRLFTSDKERWVQIMIAEEWGMPKEVRSPVKAALSTFAAFAICGFVPLAPFVFGLESAIGTATAFTAATFFIIGSLKSRWSLQRWYWSGSITLLVGGMAAGLAYLVGLLFRIYSLT